ncbi:MAG: hypothetical protein ACJ8AK_04695 [Gemmatimonadaceae bacterium]
MSVDTARVAGWRSDIAYYLEQLKQRHYVFRNRPLPPGLIQAASRVSQNVPVYSDQRMLAEFEYLASFAGDGHTYMLPFGASRVPAQMLPLRMYLFTDGLYVIDAFEGYEKWIGARVIRIGDTPAETVIDRMRPALSVDNRLGYLWVAPPLLSFRGMIEKFADGIDNGDVAMVLRPRGIKNVRVKIPTVAAPPLRGIPKLPPSKFADAPPAPVYLSNVAENFWLRDLANGVLYFQFNQVMDSPRETIASFAKRFGDHVEETKPTAIIVDVRHNNGGNLSLLPPLMAAFREYEAANPGGQIYVLMGRNTFSAAEFFLGVMDAQTKAIFAGEPSSSRPNFVGEESQVVLPWSGAMGSISDQYHETIPGDRREWIQPEIAYQLSSTDYFGNRDPLLQKVLTAIARKTRSKAKA